MGLPENIDALLVNIPVACQQVGSMRLPAVLRATGAVSAPLWGHLGRARDAKRTPSRACGKGPSSV